ncbi:MAG: CBS domain-containing protein [Euryarchaeota archaeon]|nr:CBS domain-containing protein [Euryarchaeota archaeon]
MNLSLRIFTVFGIPVELHISFLLLILFIYVLAFFNVISIQMAVLITLLFVTVVIHELSHSYVAKRYGVNIERIVLLPIGGVSAMEEIPKDPGQELKISIAGPSANFIIAIICYLIILITTNIISKDIYSFIYDFLTVNLVLGVFNLLPAFPMDGGRILRAFLARRVDYVRATEIAANVGKYLAIIMALSGIFIILNPILIFIALFVYIGADQEYKLILISSLLKGVYVRDIMTKNVITISPDTSISGALDLMFMRKHMGYPVIQDSKLIGIVTFHDLSKIPEGKRDISVSEIMTEEIILSHPDEPVVKTLEKLTKYNIGRLPVVKGGKLVGIVSKTDIMRALEILRARST